MSGRSVWSVEREFIRGKVGVGTAPKITKINLWLNGDVINHYVDVGNVAI